MADIHPYGGPKYTDWVYCYGLLEPLMPTRDDAKILAAIGGPESGYDYTVINDTPATGDYSVGIWQINYLGSLYAERSREFGTPRQLIEGGPLRQAHAAVAIWRQQGFMAWATTYTSGTWRQYVGGHGTPHPSPGPGGGLPPSPVNTGKLLAGIKRAMRELAKVDRGLADLQQITRPIGRRGWRP